MSGKQGQRRFRRLFKRRGPSWRPGFRGITSVALPERFDWSRRDVRRMVAEHSCRTWLGPVRVDARECVFARVAPVDELVKAAGFRGVKLVAATPAIRGMFRSAGERRNVRVEVFW